MLRELIRETLRCCTRDELERIQLDSSVLDELIVAGSGVLPLRTICVVDMGSFVKERLQIRVADSEDLYERPPDFSASLIDSDFDAILLRLEHAFVLDFHFRISDHSFLRHLRANAQNVEFLVNRIWFKMPAPEATDDYVLLDSIVNLLRPQAYNPLFHLYTKERWVDLLKRESFLSNIKTLNLDDNDGESVLPPSALIFVDTCYPNYKVQPEESDIAAWIDIFFDTFIRGECTNEKLESVGITWTDDHDESQKSRLPKLLSEPSVKDVRIPRDDFVAYRTDRCGYRVGQCDLYVLTSAKLKKRMDVFKWTVEVPEWSSTVHAMLCEVKDA
ncbi:hypothetical protein AAVH_31505 [Aphelenchoides avenae]|nr:hypothetical protein AAVH_31505 [Aphelenchus avenae]